MSWISDLAGKAENVLMQFDSKTASLLIMEQEADSGNVSKEHNASQYHLPLSSSVPKNLGTLGLSSENVDLQSPSRMSGSFHETSSFGSSPKKLRSKASKSKEQSFITFLNEEQVKSSNERDQNESPIIENEHISVNLVHSRQSSISSGSSFLAVSGRETPGFTSFDIESSNGSGGSGTSDPYVTIESPLDLVIPQETIEAVPAIAAPKKKLEILQSSAKVGNYLSSTSQESVLLRKEVLSLNQEMTQMLKRSKEVEKESQRMKEKLSTLNLQQKQSEALLRDMQENETKLQRLVKEKDEVISSIHLKSNDISQRMVEREKTNKELQEQNQRLLEGVGISNNMHSEVVISLQERLKDTESKLALEATALSLAREESTNRINQIQDDQKTMSRELSDLNRKLQDERTKSSSFNTQISSVKNELSAAREELVDYKAKASRILVSKERLIVSLKEGRGDIAQDELLKEELDQIMNERDLLREEITKSSERIKQLSGEIAEAEDTQQQESKFTLEQFSQFQEDIEREHSESVLAQDELKQTNQELRCSQEELTRHKVNISSRLRERDEEICRLQKQIAHKQSSSSSITELENRIHGLTESLILKQTSIESLSTDKHTLQIQLEKLQQQYQESQKMLNKDSIIDFTQDEARSRAVVPSFMMESPFDGGVTRRVKKAYGNLDKFSIRLGIFMRRYPIARVFVLIYMGLLHAWVMIVLLTYKPEIHGSDYIHPSNLGTAPRGPHE